MTTARPRTFGLNALRRRSIRPYYEPFTPKVEERDENEAHILQLELPEFNPQQVRVKVEEEKRTVTVAGDRYTGNNQLFHLDKTYPLPENCIIDKIDYKFEDGVLIITMPKETTGQSTAEAAAPPPKEPDQPTPEKGREGISPVDAALQEAKAETKRPEEAQPADDGKGQQSAELQKQVSAKAKEETPTQEAVAPKVKEETPTQEAVATKAKEESSTQEAVEPKAKEETQTQEAVAAKAKEKTLTQETVAAKAKEETPTQETLAPKAKEETLTQEAVAPRAEKGPEAEPKPTKGDSGVSETTQDQKISSLDRKATVKKEIEDQNPEKEEEEEDANAKESKTEEVGKNQEKPKMDTATPSPRGIRVARLAGCFKFGRMPFKLTASLAAAVVIAGVAYFAYAYYYHGLPAGATE